MPTSSFETTPAASCDVSADGEPAADCDASAECGPAVGGDNSMDKGAFVDFSTSAESGPAVDSGTSGCDGHSLGSGASADDGPSADYKLAGCSGNHTDHVISADRDGSAKRSRSMRRGTVLTAVASCALAAFTAFVLLDTFAIERVMTTVQEADTSSIVAAQNKTSAESAGNVGNTDSTGSASSSGESENSDGSQGATAGASSSAGDKSSASSESGSAKSHGPGGHSGGGGHRHKPGSGSGPSGGKSGSSSSESSSGGSGKSGKSGNGSSSGSSSSSSASTDTSNVVAGAAAASNVGTAIGEYSDDNMTIKVSSVRAYDTDIYVADIQVSSAEYLKTALAQNSFGRNLKDTTSNMAEQNNAVLAINGDYYGFRDDGYVLRNGVLYRETASSGTDALVVYGDGSMASASQDSTTAQQLKDAGAWQVLSFGPTLVNDGKIAVAADAEVSQSRNSNPRTAIGMISPLHYVVVVSDGRTGDNAGLSLYELAQVCIDNGATYAYNLDGGGSTTLYFKGEVINNPSSGNRSGERSVSDIVYFG